MRTLYVERSVADGSRGDWVERIGETPATLAVGEADGTRAYDRIVVGTGPGSFAGIRSALAFAQGFALGSGCEVLGLPSPCALVADCQRPTTNNQQPTTNNQQPLAVVGDARRDRYWVALFDGFRLACDIFQTDREHLPLRVPTGVKVVTPDAARIDSLLKETFGDRYLGGRTPTAEGLRRFAEANPSALGPEPLPIYLNPAVRP